MSHNSRSLRNRRQRNARRSLACSSRLRVLLPARGGEPQRPFSETKAMRGSCAELVVVVETLVAPGDAEDALGDEGAQGVAGPLGVAVIGEAAGHLIGNRQVTIHLAQQRQAGTGSDGTAVEISHHAAVAAGFNLQGFGGTLCRNRFSFKDLVNSFHKSIYQLPRTDASCLRRDIQAKRPSTSSTRRSGRGWIQDRRHRGSHQSVWKEFKS